MSTVTRMYKGVEFVMSPYNALSMIEEIGGQNAVKVFQVLNSNKDITDEQIAEITGLKLNMVRKVLYKLNESQLATYRRGRDPETGWFVYFWFLRQEKLEILIQGRQKAVLKVLQQRFDFESQNDFYTCENKCQKFVFNEAFEVGFTCPLCGSLLVQIDNGRLLKVLERKIAQLSKVIKDFETMKS